METATPANPLPEGLRLRRRTVILVAAFAFTVISLWTLGTPEGVIGKAIAIGYAICHRIAERSFQADGIILPLCARCTGIYLGVLVGYLVAAVRGRSRARRLPPRLIILALIGFAGLMALDGANSYFTLFPGYQAVYNPHNTLRLITGLYCGIALIHILLPIFNTVAWGNPSEARILDGWRDLLAVCAVGAIMILLVLSDRPLILIVLGVASAFGVLVVLTMVGTALFLTFSRRDRMALRWRELAVPMLAGLTIALIQIGVIDILRFALTRTWDGFNILAR